VGVGFWVTVCVQLGTSALCFLKCDSFDEFPGKFQDSSRPRF
jgi:hypothetical protein